MNEFPSDFLSGAIAAGNVIIGVLFLKFWRRTRDPLFRIFAGANVELGAAWQKRSEQTGNDYLSVKLDDPSFPAPIYATLTQIEGEEGYQLIWSRPTRD